MSPLASVLVVGGGPAGSVAATLLAREGMRVRLVERERFPRYHIGESLTPSCRSVLELLGLADRLDAGGFQIKRGGVFRWGRENWVVDWEKLFGPHVRSWQVDRDSFDQLLLNHARDNGVQVSEQVTARSVAFSGQRPTAVSCVRDGEAAPFVLDNFDYLVDASGRNGLLNAQHFRNRRRHEVFRNVAVWGYWRGGRTLPETPLGGLNAISAKDGWYWVVPLVEDRVSVGFVTHKDCFAERRARADSVKDLLVEAIGESEAMREVVAGAEFEGPVRVETDYSYVADRFSGPGYVVIGDAACFLDPLLATGVHLALYSALVAAASIASSVRGEVSETEALEFFEFSYRRGYARLLALVTTMYERHRGGESYFWTAQRLVGDHAPAGEDRVDSGASFGEIIAGLSDLREAADPSTRVLTARLVDEARAAQQRHMAAMRGADSADGTGGAGRPDFHPLMDMPVDGNAPNGLYLITEPRLGLRRATTCESVTGSR